MGKLPVEIRSREKPHPILHTDALTSLQICGKSLIALCKKGPEINLLRRRREKSVGVSFLSRNSTYRISCGNGSRDVTDAGSAELYTT